MKRSKGLRLSVVSSVPPARGADVLALCVFEGAAELSGASGASLELLRRLLAEGDFKAEEGQTLLVHAPAEARNARADKPEGAQPEQADEKSSHAVSDEKPSRAVSDEKSSHPVSHARRVLLVGAGERAGLSDEETCDALRRAAAAAVRRAREAGAARLCFVLPKDVDERRAARAVAEGACLGSYENDFYQADEEDEGARPSLEEFVVVARSGEELSAEVERGRIVAESANWARALADEPGASLPPREFARRALEMAEEFGLSAEVLGADEIQARGMGGLWGVGKGSDEPPALIVVRYEPAGGSEDGRDGDGARDGDGGSRVGGRGDAEGRGDGGEQGGDDGGGLWAFVGKGITFDTGGISIKPAERMEEMKGDMAGGAAALGALRAIAQLRPRRRVVAVVPTAENMPSGRSVKPGDVVRTLAGYTVEVVDTDAEGRLILIDAIAHARQLGAARIVDLATLTGSIIVALGDHRAGLFSNDDGWARAVERAARRAGEPVWRMPVSDDYKKKIESDIADFKNYGGRPDATAAALLLSKFAADTPWAHLDIAATAWLEDPQPHAPAGATGAGVRTLVELVCGG
jgi:leucyl aminopeptidase